MGQFGVGTILGAGHYPSFGEPGHYLQMRLRPSDEYPLRAIVSFPNGRAAFNSPEEAMQFLEHPGDVKHAARHYLDALSTDHQTDDSLFDLDWTT